MSFTNLICSYSTVSTEHTVHTVHTEHTVQYCAYKTCSTLTGDARRRVDTWARVQFQLFSSEGGAQHQRDSNDQDDQERPGTASGRELNSNSAQEEQNPTPTPNPQDRPSHRLCPDLHDRVPRIRNSRTRVRRRPTRLSILSPNPAVGGLGQS